MKKHYLITGGEGFIGRNLKKFLTKNNSTVKTLDISGNPDYLISVTDFDNIMNIKEEFDGIFHLAATTSPPEFDENPFSGFNVNANGTLNVLEFARIRNIPRVALAVFSRTICVKISKGNTFNILSDRIESCKIFIKDLCYRVQI